MAFGSAGTVHDPFLGLLGAKVQKSRGYVASEDEWNRLWQIKRDARRRSPDRYADAVWVESLLAENANDLPTAIALLEELRTGRDLARRGTIELWGMAHVTGRFRHLAERLARLLMQTGAETSRVLEVIEWGKGRALADRTACNAAGEPLVEQIATALRPRRRHYVSLMLTKHSVLGVLVPCEGPAMREAVLLDDATIEAFLPYNIQPAKRGTLTGDLLNPATIPDWTVVMKDVFRWIPAPSDHGPIREGDGLVVAPHGALHAFPLHELPLADGIPAGPRLTVTRTHGVAALLHAAAAPAPRPHRYLAVFSPAADDDATDSRRRFDMVTQVLARWLPGDVLDHVSDDVAAIGRKLEAGTLLHFWAHGHAPPGSFWTRSGIMLPHGGVRPVRNRVPSDADHLFAPRRLHDAGWSGALRDCHVTLQACVSGHAAANPQGDAVGLEWAFLLDGAASVLSTHWHLDSGAASLFCAAFYDAWLGERLTRAQAWQRAAQDVAGHHQHVRDWSAFSLTGAAN